MIADAGRLKDETDQDDCRRTALSFSVMAPSILAQGILGWGGGYGVFPGMGFGMMSGGWMMMSMMLIWIILIVLVVYGLISWMRTMGSPSSFGPTEKPPA